MKHTLWMMAAAVTVVAAGVTLIALPRGSEWTTSNPEALAAYEAGSEAQNKFYLDDAYEHYRRAYELDPDFLIAKLRYAQFLHGSDPEEAEKLYVELMDADLARVSPREIMFMERWRALRNRQPEEADRLVDEYVEKYPTDAEALSIKAAIAWTRNDLGDAEHLYQRLLEIDSNWVAAYNALGYIAMMQGRFAESEEHFKSYRFIAPDQANPHDSLGELYITIGRFVEAEASLNKAIEIKRDFWASYEHLAVLHSFAGNPQRIWETIASAREAGLPDEQLLALECRARYSEMTEHEEWEEMLALFEDPCIADRPLGYPSVMTHRAACEVGDWQTAKALEDRLSDFTTELMDRSEGRDSTLPEAVMSHLEGVRLAKLGEYGKAAEKLWATDNQLTFMQVSQGTFKLYNKTILAEALLASGEDAEAHKLLAGLRRINPELVDELQSSGFRVLGLGRG